MSVKRIQSAGLHRSSSNHISFLNSEICRLEEELAQSKAQNQRTSDKLSCLMSLVKNAWNGDRSASIHVAKIVGAAPPEVNVENVDYNKIVLTAKPKSKTINNWALLTIGLLNQEYKKIEANLAKEQNLRLEQRRLYLEEQLLEHRHSKMALVPPNSPRPIKSDKQPRPNISLQHKDRSFVRSYRAGSAPVRRPKQICINRPISAQKNSNAQPVFVSDLIVRSTSNQKFDEAFQVVHDLTKCIQNKRIVPQRARRFSIGSDSENKKKNWKNPNRYAGNHDYAYDGEGLLREVDGDSKPTKRPVSAKQLLENDKRRSRPKNTKVHDSKSKPNEQQKGDFTENDNNIQSEKVLLVDIDRSSDTEAEPITSTMSVTVKKTDMNDFVDELKNMEMMEDELKKTTYALQKKLGIMTEGMIL